jgi:hypothetical protein
LIGENDLPRREGFHEIRLQRNGGQGCRRASYLQDRVLGHPDPGAVAVAIWLRAVAEAVMGTPATV